jgi:uncharacterized hydrophobic protein (TIGR00271 family)
MNTPAVVIGGMIMSPLMWPLMKISIGISFAKQDYVKQAVLLLFFSVLISFLSAFLITYISPLKLVNTEIVARTNPTLLDVFVAVSAGAVAALAMAQKRISESLAGVAVATSLMPPLCVSGIGLALFDIGIFAGGFLLFITNVVSIIFISIFTFIFLGLKSKRKTQFRTESIIFMSGAMLLTAIPLFVFLNNVSFRSTTYLTAEKVLRSEMKEISPGIHVQNIQTTLEREEDIEKVDVQAEILIPEEITLDFEQRQSIIAQLEDELDRKIDLNLLIQKTISLQSEQDKQHDRMRRLLTDTFKEQIEQLDVSFAIDTLSVSIPEDSESWLVDAVLRGDSSVQFTESQRKELEYQLVQASNQAVTLDMEIISRIKLQSAPELENEKIKQDVETFIQGFSDQIDITSVAVQTPADETAGEEARTVRITASLVLPPRVSITREDLSELNDLLSKTYEKEFQIQINTIKKDTVIY